MGDNFRVITSDYVRVNVTNSQNSAVSLEQKFAKNLTIEELKVLHRIYTHAHTKFDALNDSFNNLLGSL